MTLTRSEEGFTLLEMMTVVLILGILVAIALASYAGATYRARRVACLSNQRVLDEALEVYISDTGNIADALDDLDGYATNFAEATHCPSDGRLLLLDVPAQDVYCTYPGH